ncbi:conjugal transfer protein TraI [Chitinophaga horti]|uniref:Conjugal transfer protein TraI n=1 Tax=Chitinophaga horti TaxID=2920382 RepID=A0ABY6IXY3_9BACT|nr:conjugal transfer protein TraI [Chitinophaga horti]UYQ92155.1 conjugal transfer protein TraI [Chitinophaga horti]
MRRILFISMLMICVGFPAQKANAQIVILDIIKAGIKKVIKAVDLQVQRQQNKVIWLQNAQKVLENALSKLKLTEISEWTEKQRNQYKIYFQELHKVKSLITYYKRIKDISAKEARLVHEYQRAWRMVRGDKRFTPREIEYMGKVYLGMLDETVKNIEQLMVVVNSFRTQMTDAKRLEIIHAVSERVDQNYNDLLDFNRENALLSLQRARAGAEQEEVKQLYGLK